MVDRAHATEDLVLTPVVVEEALGEEGKLTGVRVRNLETDEVSVIPRTGSSSRSPRSETKLFVDQLDHDSEGFTSFTQRARRRRTSKASSPPAMSSDHVYRQAVTRPAWARWRRSTPSGGLSAPKGHAETGAHSARANMAEWVDLSTRSRRS